MKKNFLTGLAILLPAVLTFWFLIFIIDLLTDPFIDITENFIHRFNFFNFPTLFLSRCLVLIILVLITLLTGFFGQTYLLQFIFNIVDSFIKKIPLINSTYKNVQEVIYTFLDYEKKKFIKVVLVPFPHEKSYCLGFMTTEKIPVGSDANFNDKLSICVVGSPNPTLGFMLLYDRSQVIILDNSVEETLKYLISCGNINVDFKPYNPL